MKEMFVTVTDESQRGARLDVSDIAKPQGGCPSLGGWKKSDNGWFTTVKEYEANRILNI